MSEFDKIVTKISIGVQPVRKMFRLGTLHGVLVDDLISIKAPDSQSGYYFEQVITNASEEGFSLRDEDETHMLVVKIDNIVYTQDYIKSDLKYYKKEFLSNFESVWSKVHGSLAVSNIRRLGIIAEAEMESENSNISKYLIENLTKIKIGAFPAKFSLKYEERQPTKEKVTPDIKKDDLTNTIVQIREVKSRKSETESTVIALSVDSQRYYAPTLETGSKVLKEVRSLFESFDKRSSHLLTALGNMGVEIG